MKTWRSLFGEHAALGGLLLLAFALRVYRLGAQAIWWDESLSVYRATRDFGTVLANTIVIQNIVTTDTLPQLYFVFLHFLAPAFGVSEFALRFLSVFANVATVALIYALARRWFGAATARIAACLAALSPFYVWYAQEARPYALILFWSTLALYALTRAFEKTGSQFHVSRFTFHMDHFPLCVATYLLASAAALLTHYFALFLFPVHALGILIWVWRRNTWRARAWVLLPAIPLAALVPLMPQITTSVAGNAATGPDFVPLDIILRDLLHSFSVGVTADFAQTWGIDAALAGIFLIGAVVPNSKFKIQNSNSEFRILNLLCLFLPILLVFAASFVRPVYQNSRYLIAISPAFYLGVAAGIVALARWKPLALIALGVYACGALIALDHWYFDPRFGKDDHRAWARDLRERARPGDALILNSPHAEELYRYYAGDRLPLTTLPILRADGKPTPDADRAAIQHALDNHARVWYLEMDVPFDDPERRIEKILNAQAVLLDRANFAATSTEIALALFVKNFPTTNANRIAHPLDAAFAGNLRLRGFDAPTALAPGARGVVTLFWQLDAPVGEDYAVSLRLTDAAGANLGQWDAIPLGNRAGSSAWTPQQIVASAHDFRLAPNLAAGIYRWRVVPYHAATGNPLGDVIPLGEIFIGGN